jgi:hypothetical protein
MAASAKRASWSVTGLRGSSPNATAICERDRDLRLQQLERVLSYAAHDSLYLSLTRGGGLRGEDDQQPVNLQDLPPVTGRRAHQRSAAESRSSDAPAARRLHHALTRRALRR